MFYNSNFKLYHSPHFKIYSKSNESKAEFILKLNQLAREARDEEIDKIEQKYAKEIQKLKSKLSKSQEILLKNKHLQIH